MISLQYCFSHVYVAMVECNIPSNIISQILRITMDPTLEKRAVDPLIGGVGRAEGRHSSKSGVLIPHPGPASALLGRKGLAEMRCLPYRMSM